MSVNIEYGYDRLDEVKELFKEYTDMLVSTNKEFEKSLKYQNYDLELENIKEKYPLPKGRLYVATVDDKVIGCIALRYIDDETCELKRFYVKPKFRGNKIGESLVKRLIDDANKIGYKYMLLDTLPFLKEAMHLYKKLGFYETEGYYDSPVKETIYFKLDL